MQIKISKSDVIWNYIGIVLSMTSNLLLLPFYLKFLDSDILGLWYVYLSIGSIVILFDFGFNPTLARNVAYCWSGAQDLQSNGVTSNTQKEPNYSLLKNVLCTCKRVYLIIALLAGFILLTAGSAYIYYVSKEIFNEEIIISWIIYSLAVVFNLYYGYFATFLRGVGAVSQYNKINVVARLVQIILSIVLLILNVGIIAVAIAYLSYGLLIRVLSKRVFYKFENIGEKLNEIKIKVSGNEIRNVFKIIWHNAWRDGVVAVSNYFAGHASTLIASMFLNLTDTGTYSISVQLVTAIATIAAGLYTAYQPAMQSSYASSNNEETKRLISISMLVNFILFWLGIIGLVLIGIPLLKIIKPDYVYSIPIIIGIAIYTFVYKRQSLYSSFISNTNHVPYMNSYLITSIIGVILSIILTKFLNLGMWGLILGQCIPQLFYNCWKWPHEVYKMLKTTWFKFIEYGFKKTLCLFKGEK